MDVEESSALQSSFNSCLKLMNEFLLCAICKEVFVTPVIINICSHNFCSICIRRYFTIKQECPLCGLEASTSNLSPNRIIETMIKHFDNLRSVLKNIIEKPNFHKHKQKTTNKASTSTTESEAGEDVDLTGPIDPKDNFQYGSITEGPIEATPRFSLGLKDFSTQSQGFSADFNIAEKTGKTITNNSNNNEKPNNQAIMVKDGGLDIPVHGAIETESLQPTKAECPVCGISVDTSAINNHLDGCLAREEKKNSLRQNTPKRVKRNKPPTAKLAYNLLSLRELRKKLKEIGLATNGDKNELKRRHQEFLVKYQAEMDKSEPRNGSVVIDEMKREETRKKDMEKKTKFLGKLSPTKSNDSEKENREYIRNHAKQYKSLEEIVEKSLPKKRRKSGTDRKLFDAHVELEEDISKDTNKDSSEGIAPDSHPFTPSPNDGLIFNNISACAEDLSGSSPELYIDEPCTSGEGQATLRQKVDADSQRDEIKEYIDASLSEAY